MSKRKYSIIDGVGEKGGHMVIDLSNGACLGTFRTYYAAYKYTRNGSASRDAFNRNRDQKKYIPRGAGFAEYTINSTVDPNAVPRS
jgi:hypothetical protein